MLWSVIGQFSHFVMPGEGRASTTKKQDVDGRDIRRQDARLRRLMPGHDSELKFRTHNLK
jgi:hypothetical protein